MSHLDIDPYEMPTPEMLAANEVIMALERKGWIVCHHDQDRVMVNPRLVLETIAAVFME